MFAEIITFCILLYLLSGKPALLQQIRPFPALTKHVAGNPGILLLGVKSSGEIWAPNFTNNNQHQTNVERLKAAFTIWNQ